MKIPFYKHTIIDEDIDEVTKILKSQFITTASETSKFENNFSKYTNNKFTIGVNSATSALHLSLIANGIQKGDEVITTPLTFVSTINVIEMVGAKPILVDVEKDTGLIDLEKIKNAITDKTKAIMPVHLYGNMVNIKELKNIVKNKDIAIIEDSAHCIEGNMNKYRPGNISNTACFSFYATKNLTCGEGGAIVCNNKEIYENLKILRLHGLSKNAVDRYKTFSQYDVEMLGYKYNMYDIQAALLIKQLDRLNENHIKRKKIIKKYHSLFDKLGLSYPKIPENSKSAYHLAVAWVDKKIRDELIDFLQKKEIGVSIHFKPIHEFSYYKKKYNFAKNDFPNADEIYQKSISLPLFPSLTNDEFEYIKNSLINFFK